MKLGDSRLGGSGLFERDQANAPRTKVTRREDRGEPDLYRGRWPADHAHLTDRLEGFMKELQK